jgi:hypothetical protein
MPLMKTANKTVFYLLADVGMKHAFGKAVGEH